jgi:hypothetical protein
VWLYLLERSAARHVSQQTRRKASYHDELDSGVGEHAHDAREITGRAPALPRAGVSGSSPRRRTTVRTDRSHERIGRGSQPD